MSQNRISWATQTPRVGKVDDEDPNENNRRPSSCPVFAEFTLVCTDDSCHDEMADSHSDRTGDQDLLTSDLIDPKHSRDGEDELENTDNASSQQGGCITG